MHVFSCDLQVFLALVVVITASWAVLQDRDEGLTGARQKRGGMSLISFALGGFTTARFSCHEWTKIWWNYRLRNYIYLLMQLRTAGFVVVHVGSSRKSSLGCVAIIQWFLKGK